MNVVVVIGGLEEGTHVIDKNGELRFGGKMRPWISIV